MNLLTKYLFYLLIFTSVQVTYGFEIEDIPVQDEGRIKPLDTY